jgi:peroxiredoxin
MRLIKTSVSFFSVALCVALVSLAFAADKPMKAPAIGEEAPLFSLQDQDGKSVSLADYRGKFVVLEWFNNECPFVQKWYNAGDMNKLAGKYAGKDVAWLAINTTHGKTNADNKAAAADFKISRPILNDSNGSVGRAYRATNTPQMIVIDKAGHIAYMGAIDNNNTTDESKTATARNYVSKALDELLGGSSVSEPETKPYGCSVKYAD